MVVGKLSRLVSGVSCSFPLGLLAISGRSLSRSSEQGYPALQIQFEVGGILYFGPLYVGYDMPLKGE